MLPLNVQYGLTAVGVAETGVRTPDLKSVSVKGKVKLLLAYVTQPPPTPMWRYRSAVAPLQFMLNVYIPTLGLPQGYPVEVLVNESPTQKKLQLLRSAVRVFSIKVPCKLEAQLGHVPPVLATVGMVIVAEVSMVLHQTKNGSKLEEHLRNV